MFQLKIVRCIPLLRRIRRKSQKEPSQSIPRVEKDYLKPAYSASIGEEVEDGLFDGNIRYKTISVSRVNMEVEV